MKYSKKEKGGLSSHGQRPWVFPAVLYKTVVLSGNVNKQHFLRFLSAARIYRDKVPTICDKNGTDIVVVCGYIEAETNNEITVCVNTPNGGYAFGITPSAKQC